MRSLYQQVITWGLKAFLLDDECFFANQIRVALNPLMIFHHLMVSLLCQISLIFHISEGFTDHLCFLVVYTMNGIQRINNQAWRWELIGSHGSDQYLRGGTPEPYSSELLCLCKVLSWLNCCLWFGTPECILQTLLGLPQKATGKRMLINWNTHIRICQHRVNIFTNQPPMFFFIRCIFLYITFTGVIEVKGQAVRGLNQWDHQWVSSPLRYNYH